MGSEKYILKNGEDIYYPVSLDIDFNDENHPYIKKEGHTGISYFVKEKGKYHLRIRSLNSKHLSHLNFPDIETNPPKVFIHQDLINLLSEGKEHTLSHVLESQIINAKEIEHYQNYFNIFRTKEPENIFSKFKGALFPKI